MGPEAAQKLVCAHVEETPWTLLRFRTVWVRLTEGACPGHTWERDTTPITARSNGTRLSCCTSRLCVSKFKTDGRTRGQKRRCFDK
jgi:hypothetical protein